MLLYRCAEACGYVREQRKQDGRPGAPTEPFVCLGFATYESHEGARPMAWLPAVAWHSSGVDGWRRGAGQQAKGDGA